jgi:hypothetical protein
MAQVIGTLLGILVVFGPFLAVIGYCVISENDYKA